MKYYDYYLKATDETHLNNSLEFLKGRRFVNLDIIGIIHKNIGTEEEPDYVEQPGYHANLRLKEQLSQERVDNLPLITPPDTPVRVWA